MQPTDSARPLGHNCRHQPAGLCSVAPVGPFCEMGRSGSGLIFSLFRFARRRDGFGSQSASQSDERDQAVPVA